MLLQSGHRGLSIAFWCPIVVFAWDRPSESVSPSEMSAHGIHGITFPIVRADSPDSDCGPSPPPTADVGGQHLQHLELTLRSVLRPSTLRRRRHCRKMATMMRGLCWTVPQRVIMTTALLLEKVVQ